MSLNAIFVSELFGADAIAKCACILENENVVVHSNNIDRIRRVISMHNDGVSRGIDDHIVIISSRYLWKYDIDVSAAVVFNPLVNSELRASQEFFNQVMREFDLTNSPRIRARVSIKFDTDWEEILSKHLLNYSRSYLLLRNHYTL